MKSKPLIISGHQRSGTSLVQRICDLHPDLQITSEAGIFFGLGAAPPIYRKNILRQTWLARNRSYFSPKERWGRTGYDVVEASKTSTAKISDLLQKGVRLHQLQNYYLILRFLSSLKAESHQIITPTSIKEALQHLYPDMKIVGDKHPDYIYQLQKYSTFPDLFWLILVRDPRDMTNSVLKAYQRWGDRWGKEVSTAKNIAKRWVKIVALLDEQKQKPNMLIVRYEDIVRDSGVVFEKISDWLGVNLQGFNLNLIHADRIGAYKKELKRADLAEVLTVAGPAMERIGYRI